MNCLKILDFQILLFGGLINGGGILSLGASQSNFMAFYGVD